MLAVLLLLLLQIGGKLGSSNLCHCLLLLLMELQLNRAVAIVLAEYVAPYQPALLVGWQMGPEQELRQAEGPKHLADQAVACVVSHD